MDRRGHFDVVVVWAFDRLLRKHLLEVLDELNYLEIESVSFRENIDTGGPLGRAIIMSVGAIAFQRILKEEAERGISKGVAPAPLQVIGNQNVWD